jgi:hypothetical protein
MLENVKSDVNNRITELRSILIHIDDLQKSVSTSVPIVPLQVNIIKGLFFVHLYSVLEFTVTSLAQETLQHIGTKNIQTNNYKPLFLSIILDSNCNSLEAGNGKKHWDRRRKLFQEIEDNNILPLDITILPTGEGNLKYNQLKSLLDTFCMTCDAVPEKRYIGRLEELVENRNKIAHGRESTVVVGSRYSISDLNIRLTDTIAICTYLTNVFDQYLLKETYKKS